MSDRLDVAVGVPDFVSAPTFGALRALVAGEPERPAGVTVFRSTGSDTPVVFVPPGAGTSLGYRRLAELLGADRPCYGLESPADPPLRDITAIAAHHVAQLRTIRPGPYVLAGWSIGAITAHEMAIQLAAKGETVERIVGIDGFVPDTGGRPLGRSPGWSVRGAWYRAAAATGLDRRLPPGSEAVYHANIAAMLNYRPSAAPTAAVLLKVRLTASRARRLHRSVAPLYTGGVEVLPARGTHWTVLDPGHVDELAAQIARVITLGRGRPEAFL